MCRPEWGELEPLWHHTDNFVRVSIQHDRLSEHVEVARKSTLPQPVTQNDLAVRAVFILSRDKQTAKHRLDAEHGEEILRHLQARNVFGRFDPGEVRSEEHT